MHNQNENTWKYFAWFTPTLVKINCLVKTIDKILHNTPWNSEYTRDANTTPKFLSKLFLWSLLINFSRNITITNNNLENVYNSRITTKKLIFTFKKFIKYSSPAFIKYLRITTQYCPKKISYTQYSRACCENVFSLLNLFLWSTR